MKKLISLVATLALALSAQAVTLFPNGTVASDGNTLSGLLSSGWTQVYNTGYGSGAVTQADISSWGSAAGSGYVFVGGIDQSGNVILGATGLASEVLTQTFSDSIAGTYSSSNLYWYNRNNYGGYDPYGSFGFSPTQAVSLSEADVSGVNGQYRLSWHLNFAGGGYRLGNLQGLNYDNTYNRIVLVAAAGNRVPDSGSTALLIGAALVSVAALRRRFAV